MQHDPHTESPALSQCNSIDPSHRLPIENAAGGNECGATRIGPAGGNLSEGAPPSNTAPPNYRRPPSNGIRILRCAVDSLYLSYPGDLSQDRERQLLELKLCARSDDDHEIAKAQLAIGEHLFEVSDRGQGRFPYVLADNCYRIQVSSPESHSLPLAYAQIRSETLTALSLHEAEYGLRYIVNTLGLVNKEANISRVDLCVDFCSDMDMDSWSPEAWITRAHKITQHHIQRQFSGWSIGLGGDMGARLYDKTLELEKSKKDYLKPLWTAAGWKEDEPVWRLEFQFRRPSLKELGVPTFSELRPNLGGLWRYGAESWLRLAIPSATDDNTARWPTHPLWDALAAADWHEPSPPVLTRIKRTRVPSDDSLFVNGIGAFSSFMAREGITDIEAGIRAFVERVRRYHETPEHAPGSGLKHYLAAKVALKGRKYNTLKAKRFDDSKEKQKAANAYRKQRDGMPYSQPDPTDED
jgi:hypothetical protein